MLAIVSDTHGTDGHRLEGRTLEAVRRADLVIHGGDFTTETVLEAFEREAGTRADGEPDAGRGRLRGVWGNRDDEGVRERLPARRVVEWAGLRLVIVHGHDHDETALSFLGRQEGADVVVVGHSHQPGVDQGSAVTVLNPGSHADPRWHRPAHAELESTPMGVSGRLVTPDGDVIREFDVSAGA